MKRVHGGFQRGARGEQLGGEIEENRGEESEQVDGGIVNRGEIVGLENRGSELVGPKEEDGSEFEGSVGRRQRGEQRKKRLNEAEKSELLERLGMMRTRGGNGSVLAVAGGERGEVEEVGGEGNVGIGKERGENLQTLGFHQGVGSLACRFDAVI